MKYLRTPLDPQLDKLLMNIRNAQRRGDEAKGRRLSQAWLLLQYDAFLGDTVRVHAWSQPREIFIEDFRLGWSGPRDSLHAAFLWFEGPSALYRKCVYPDRHGCPMGTIVEKVAPSEQMRRKHGARMQALHDRMSAVARDGRSSPLPPRTE